MFRSLRGFSLFALAFALFVIPQGLISFKKGRETLLWPVVPGKMMQADVSHHSSRHSSYYLLQATYTYFVDGARHISHQICIWSPDLARAGTARSFAQAHPVYSAVDVHYDPQNPDNAVLIPGADEFRCKLYFWGGGILIPIALFGLFSKRKEAAQVAAQCRAEAAGAPTTTTGRAEPTDDGEPFLTCEPALKRKLAFYPDRECLLEALGHGGQKIQDWTADDRAIDSTGQVFRIVRQPGKNCYDIEATGETWTWQKLLDLATADARIIKKDPRTIINRADSAPENERIPTIMRCVDELPSAPTWLWVGLGIFLLLFFIAVVAVTWLVIKWVGK